MTTIPDKVIKDKAEAEAQREKILRGDNQADKADATPKVTETKTPEAKEQPKEDQAPVKDEVEVKGEVDAGDVVPFPSENNEAKLTAEIERLKKEQQRVAGQLGSEIQKWREQLQVAMEDNIELAKQLRDSKESESRSKPTESIEDVDTSKYLSDEEKNDYSEMVGVIAKVARAVAESIGSKYDAPVTELKEQVGRMSVEQIANQFLNAVESLAPGFKSANGNPDLGIAPQDPEWIAYLGIQNEITGKTLGVEIMEIQSQDARIRAAANAFKAYQKTKAKPDSGSVKAEDVVPQRRKSSSSSTPSDKARTTDKDSITIEEFNQNITKARTMGLQTAEGDKLYRLMQDYARRGKVTT